MASGRLKTEMLSPSSVKVRLSVEAQRAFGDLAAAVRFSDYSDKRILSIVEDFANGTNFSVEDVICSLPLIAADTFRHIHACGDGRAEQAWRAIGEALSEHGFSLAKERTRSDHGHPL
jgi:hypothetical protein